MRYLIDIQSNIELVLLNYQRTMKIIFALIMITFLFGFSGNPVNDKKERKAKARQEMAELIGSGKFRFVARSANSELGNFNNLSSSYDMAFDSLKIKAYLPYYGRAYSVPYGGSGGVKFDLVAENIEKIWNEKKKLYTISTEVSDSEDSYSINLTAGLDGYADLKINFRNRRWISYFGVIEKVEEKDQKEIKKDR